MGNGDSPVGEKVMAEQVSETREGWAFITNSPKWHYLRNGRSLCGKWMVLRTTYFEQGNENSRDNCAACRKKRLAELAKAKAE